MHEWRKNKILFGTIFWLCSSAIRCASEATEVTTNYTLNENDLILNIVHTSKNRSQKHSNIYTTPYPTELYSPHPTSDNDSVTNIPNSHTSNKLHSHNTDATNSSISPRGSKDDELLNKVRYYLKYLETLEDKSTFSGEKRRALDEDVRKKPMKRLAFLDKMLEDYDKRAWPTYGTDSPTAVTVNIYVNTLGPVNAAQMEYGMDIYLRQMWNDPRLQLSRYGVHHMVTLNAEDIAQHIWKPDIFFRNVKQASFHKVTVPNKLIKLYPNGDVLYSMRITMKLACHMSFRHYPLDCQRCHIVLGSYAQTTDQVLISWQDRNPIVIEQALEMPEFDVTGVSHSSFTRSIDTGAFSFLNVTFVLYRQNGFHLIQTYMPTFLIVMISWVSFWLNVDATPARVTLGVTTLLTLTTVAYGVRLQLPPVSYIKAIDVWIGACSVMVFGALLEFTLVNYLSRSKLRPGEIKNSFNIFHWNKKLHMAQDIEGALKTEEELAKNLKRARCVDRFCRIMFPVAFFVFNVAYWLYYLYVPDVVP